VSAGKPLSDEDRVLWSLVARTARPLKGKKSTAAETPEPEPRKAHAMGATLALIPPTAPPARKQHVFHVLDNQTQVKLAKGRLQIEGRVDLHGMTQAEAYDLLLSFLRRAQANDGRYVLVITGKGSSSGGDGVLRRSVPAWLATAPFRPLVSGYDNAARNHGGGGALYVRLRKPAVIRR
jgi:DNA-nicking Smr family endonuclease